MKRSKETKPVHQFSASLRQGFCLGCGGKTRKGGGTGTKRDTFNWHPNCYRRFNEIWTKGIKYQRKRCRNCGKMFEATGPRYHSVTCSATCNLRYQNKVGWERRREAGKPAKFSTHIREGFCLGCGGKTRYVKDQKKLTGRQGDSLNWHYSCYWRTRAMWTEGLYRYREKRCAICGKPFLILGSGWKKKTCSEECRAELIHRMNVNYRKKHKARSMPIQERACLVCGKRFTVGGGHGKWNKKVCGAKSCCKELLRRSSEAWRKAHPRPHKIKNWRKRINCVVCGKPFMIARRAVWNQKTCSIECRYEHLRRGTYLRGRPFPRQERACVICGKRFLVGGGLGRWKKITCSPGCLRLRRRQTTAAWSKARAKPLTLQK